MPCLAEEVLKAPVGQPAFQQLKGAAALYCQSPSLSRSLAARHIGAPLPRYAEPPYMGNWHFGS